MDYLSNSVEKYYSEWPGYDGIVENLRRKGIDPAEVSVQHLFPYDQAHAGGIEATRTLATYAGIQRGAFVVDVGCGIGGAARYLRHELSCRVLGVDLTPARLRIGTALNRLAQCTDGIGFVTALAESLPVATGFADAVWTQHVTMNLPDSRSFVGECARVLKPSGRMALHEWFLRPGSAQGKLSLPLPWAPVADLNHVISSEEFLEMLREQAFAPVWQDVTEIMIARLQKDTQALIARGGPASRIAAQQNLVTATAQGILHCLMITSEPRA